MFNKKSINSIIIIFIILNSSLFLLAKEPGPDASKKEKELYKKRTEIQELLQKEKQEDSKRKKQALDKMTLLFYKMKIISDEFESKGELNPEISKIEVKINTAFKNIELLEKKINEQYKQILKFEEQKINIISKNEKKLQELNEEYNKFKSQGYKLDELKRIQKLVEGKEPKNKKRIK